MITFHLREFTHQFFQHTLVVSEQDITFEKNTNEYKYLQFTGCDHVVLKLLNINVNVLDESCFDYNIDEYGTHKIQVLPPYNEFTICIIEKEDPYLVYDGFTHRQDITSDTRRLEIVC